MKNSKLTKAFLMAAAMFLSGLMLFDGVGSTVEAASKVTVKKIAAVNTLTGSKTIRLAKGKKATLKTTVTVTPNKSANKKVTYSTSNKKIATVSSKGVITGKKAGTAKITVTSKKNKKKKVTVTVKVMKGQVKSIKLGKTSGTLTVGDSTKLKPTIKTSANGSKDVVFTTSNKSVATVSKSGTVNAKKQGTATITVRAADGTGKKVSYKLTVKKKTTTKVPADTKTPTGTKTPTDTNTPTDTKTPENIKAATSFGFSLSSWSDKSTYKVETTNSRNNDGSNTYEVKFYCNGDEKWIDENIIFELQDVTPNAYKKVFEDMGIPVNEMKITTKSEAGFLREWYYYTGYEYKIQEKFTLDGPGKKEVPASSGKSIIINAGAGTRAVKVTAKLKNGTILDYIYAGPTGYTREGGSGTYSEYDTNLYKKIRVRIEAKIWTNSMSNLQKLAAMAEYINSTTHYPGTQSTTKEYNPTFWKDWSVDDKALFYNMFNDVKLNRIMDMQGGIVTCQAADILETVAREDLGLPNLYDGKNDVREDAGEGVWIGMGSYSSNPGNPYHESLIYQNAQGERTLLDAQGKTYYGSEAACEKHGCRSKIVSLK